MLKRLLNYFITKPTLPSFHPVKTTFFRSQEVAEILHREGYYIVDFMGESERQSLLNLYKKNRPVPRSSGAYSGVISKSIHDSINQILYSSFEKWFRNYKNIVSAFAVKTPGSDSSVPIHQDVTEIDEAKYSTINVWMPLDTLGEADGTLYIIPRSHYIFVPFRSGTIDPITKNIEDILSPYFIPIYLKLGQALLFDSRMFHSSPPNISNHDRVVVLCKICPAEAEIMVCFKDRAAKHSKIELWRCPEDYLIHGEHHDDNARPLNCELIEYKDIELTPLTPKEFEQLRSKYGISPLFKNGS